LLTSVRITEILIGGVKPTTKPDEALKAKYAAKLAANGVVSVSAASATKPAAKASPKKSTAKAEAEAPAEAKAAKAPAKAKAAKPATDFVDDIKLIGGVGPALEKKLIAAGVTSLKDIAGWTAADIEKYDAELELHGRAERDEWVAQAKDLVAGKPPRAKADQELQASEQAAAKPAKPAAKKTAPKADKE
jgi:large subunit ribosomal protein L21